MTYHLATEREKEFVESMRSTLDLIELMIKETGGRWGDRNGTNAFLTTVHERVQTVYLEAVTFLGLTGEHERLEEILRERLFNSDEAALHELTANENRWPLDSNNND